MSPSQTNEQASGSCHRKSLNRYFLEELKSSWENTVQEARSFIPFWQWFYHGRCQ